MWTAPLPSSRSRKKEPDLNSISGRQLSLFDFMDSSEPASDKEETPAHAPASSEAQVAVSAGDGQEEPVQNALWPVTILPRPCRDGYTEEIAIIRYPMGNSTTIMALMRNWEWEPLRQAV